MSGRCSNDLDEQRKHPTQPQIAKYSAANGMVPPPVPPVLQNLTMAEEMLISRASPVVKVVRLSGGMHGYEGHVVSIGQDIGELAMRLPWLPNSHEIPVIIVQPPSGGGWAGRHFKVNLDKVERALNYLFRHNPGYQDTRLTLDMGRLRDSLQSESRDDDGDIDVLHLLHTVTAAHDGVGEGEGDGGGEAAGDGGDGGDGDGGGGEGEGHEERAPRLDYRGVERMPNPLNLDPLHVDTAATGPEGASGLGARPSRGPTESFVPSADVRERSEADALREALMEMTGYRANAGGGEGGPSLDHPRTTGPLREDTPWLASMCFPTLFPNGVGDPFGAPQQRDVSLVGRWRCRASHEVC